MKAAPAVQRRLLELAEVDAELNRVDHRRKRLPELEEIGHAERDLQAKRDSLVSAQTAHGDLERDAGRWGTEIEQVRTREQRDRALMDSGELATPKQIENVQNELESLTRRQGSLEDELLEVMERREATETDVEKARGEVASAEEKLAEVQGRRDEALLDLDSTEVKRKAERETLVADLPENLLSLYERVRGQKGTGAGPLQSNRCGACRLELDRTTLSEVREAQDDDVIRCAECGAIIVRGTGA